MVEPLPSRDAEPLYMIVFVEAEAAAPLDAPSSTVAAPEGDAPLAQLERENSDLREQLRSVAEEHATAIEELEAQTKNFSRSTKSCSPATRNWRRQAKRSNRSTRS